MGVRQESVVRDVCHERSRCVRWVRRKVEGCLAKGGQLGKAFCNALRASKTHHPFEGVLMGDEDGKFFSFFFFWFYFSLSESEQQPALDFKRLLGVEQQPSSSVSRAPTELSRAEKRLLPARPSRHVVQRPPLLRRCEDEGHAGPHVGQPGESGSHRRRGS